MQLSKWRKCKATDLKSFFLIERKLLNAILRVKLKYMKIFLHMKWNVICNAEDRFFHVLELFCRASHVRASMHRITSFRASKNTNAVFSATKQMKRMQGHGCLKSFFLSERKLLNAIFKSKAQVHKEYSSYERNVICNAEDRFSCVRAFCRASHFRASMHRITSFRQLLRTLMLCLCN